MSMAIYTINHVITNPTHEYGDVHRQSYDDLTTMTSSQARATLSYHMYQYNQYNVVRATIDAESHNRGGCWLTGWLVG